MDPGSGTQLLHVLCSGPGLLTPVLGKHWEVQIGSVVSLRVLAQE